MYITTFADSYVQINYSLSLSLSLLFFVLLLIEKDTTMCHPAAQLARCYCNTIFTSFLMRQYHATDSMSQTPCFFLSISESVPGASIFCLLTLLVAICYLGSRSINQYVNTIRRKMQRNQVNCKIFKNFRKC